MAADQRPEGEWRRNVRGKGGRAGYPSFVLVVGLEGNEQLFCPLLGQPVDDQSAGGTHDAYSAPGWLGEYVGADASLAAS